MNISNLASGAGFKAFLQSYHQLLNKKYKFQALSGMKPAHRAAEVLGFERGEQLLAALDKQHLSPFTLNALNTSTRQENQQLLWLRKMKNGDHVNAINIAGDMLQSQPHNAHLLFCLATSYRLSNGLVFKRDYMSLYHQILTLGHTQQDPLFSWQRAILTQTLETEAFLRAQLSIFASEIVSYSHQSMTLAQHWLPPLIQAYKRAPIKPWQPLFSLLDDFVELLSSPHTQATLDRIYAACKAIAIHLGRLAELDIPTLWAETEKEKRIKLIDRHVSVRDKNTSVVSRQAVGPRLMKSHVYSGKLRYEDFQQALGLDDEGMLAFEQGELFLDDAMRTALNQHFGFSIEVLKQMETPQQDVIHRLVKSSTTLLGELPTNNQ